MRSPIKSMLACVGLLYLMVGSAFAQSSLPPCQGSDFSKWNNCYGTMPSLFGSKYFGQFKDGRLNGWGEWDLGDDHTSASGKMGGAMEGGLHFCQRAVNSLVSSEITDATEKVLNKTKNARFFLQKSGLTTIF